MQSILVPKWLYNGTQHWKTRKQPALQKRPPVVAQDGGLDPRALSKSIPKLQSLDTQTPGNLTEAVSAGKTLNWRSRVLPSLRAAHEDLWEIKTV